MWFLPLTFKKLSFMWDMTGKTGSESSRAAFSRLLLALRQSPLKTDLGGVVCFKPRQDTT